ncbi:putative polyketide synthase [Lasiosphaeria miniovina]|uniref:Polyketide synthase n=1 Tax=Lasiosphaeria miniovina TaxID=1954250 RepID=A0AA40DUC4_9PEZI|nr:putative polyketide synthase [Lasiosphaeria miniovina]KAK0713556.1 putative polyketide synthase [Lasiosphaeria miniovina]
MSGILALPLLTIIQVVQYFQYLGWRGIGHAQFLREIKAAGGGAQGFCGGLLPAMAVAASRDEAEVVGNAARALRIALGIGAYGELGDDENEPGPTTVVLRAKYEGQAGEIVARFPGAHVSAITDPLSVSIVGPVRVLEALKKSVETDEGLPVTQVNLRGKVHNPENRTLSAEFCRLCDEHDELRLPTADALLVPVRANATGELLGHGPLPLAHEIIYSTLVTRCEWHTLLQGMSKQIKETSSRTTHTFAMFGTGRKNCVPSAAFEENGLSITKLDVMQAVAAPHLHKSILSVEGYPKDAIAIVGAACRLPGADSLEDLWEVVSSGQSKAAPLPTSRLDGNLASRVSLDSKRQGTTQQWWGNFVENIDAFDNTFFGISPREAQYMDPQQRLLLETAYEALDSAGYLRHHRRDDFDNVGCFVGTTYVEYLENTTGYGATAYAAPGTIRAFQTGRISYHFGWSGPSEAIDTACSSSLVAIHRACRALQAGECPMALAGGVNLITGIQNFLDLGKAGFLSTTGQCKPFDEAADGYCRADGVGLVVLKPLRRAVADGDHVLGVIPGIATNHGGLSSSITVPYSRAQTALFKNVLERTGLAPHHISYVEAHGPGTQVGDPIEISSVREVLGGAARRGADELLSLGSLKGNVGHSETAAGVGSLLKVLAMLQHRQLPPLAGFRTLNRKIAALEPDRLTINSAGIQPWTAPFRAALINSYGAAGSNSALVCSEAPRSSESVTSVSVPGSGSPHEELSYPVFLSAANAESLGMNVTKLASYLQRTDQSMEPLSIGNVSLTLYERRKHHHMRWVGTESDLGALSQTLEPESGSVAKGMFEVASQETVKPVVLVFSGQSRRNIQLNRDWYRWFPRLRFHLERCNDIVKSLGHDAILPHVLFQSEPVSDVVALQCGTFAVQFACAQTWIDAGLKVEVVVGHSFGELTAMVVSGVLSLEDGLRLVSTRASLMKEKWVPERGTMLAIHAAPAVVEHVIVAVCAADPMAAGRLEIACFNGPASQVVVGSASDIERAEQVLGHDPRFGPVKCQRVDVSHGFHSVFTESILEDLEASARALTFNPPVIRLETCTETPLDSISHGRIAKHTRTPVFFSQAIARIEERLGSCIWLEAGADSPIISMTKKAVQNAGANHVSVSLRSSEPQHKTALAAATAALWREGVSVSFWPFITPADSSLRPVWLPPYQFQRKRHWLEWIDPVDQARKAGLASHGEQNPLLQGRTAAPAALVTPLGTLSDSWASLQFTLHTTTRRFTDIVSGHAIRGLPLCPASMYMEAVVMAAQQIKPEIGFQAFQFEHMTFPGALGLDPDRHVVLTMEGAGEYLAWKFSFGSSNPQAKHASAARGAVGKAAAAAATATTTTHAKGGFSVASRADLGLLERVVHERMEAVLADPRAERLGTRRAYALFSRVVNYSPLLRGIESITMLGGEHAVARVRQPQVDRQPEQGSESTAARVCDTIGIDTFIQVVGLLMNSGEGCPEDEVFIATGIDRIFVQDCDFAGVDEWDVYATCLTRGGRDGREVAGDLMVFTRGGRLVLTGSGIRFTHYPIAKLERLLEKTSTASASKKTSAAIGGGGDRRVPAISTAASTLPGPGHVARHHDQGEKTLVGEELLSSTADAKFKLGMRGLDSMMTVRLAGQLKQSIGGGAAGPRESGPLTLATADMRLHQHQEPPQLTPPSSSPSDDGASHGNGNLQHASSDAWAMRTRQRLLELISENSGAPPTSIHDSASLQDIGLDSLSLMELKSSVEDTFVVQLGHDDLHAMSTVADMLDLLRPSGQMDVLVVS